MVVLEPKFCAYVRHAETIDEILGPMGVIPRKESNHYDPPLSKMGVAQAVITGQYLKAFFENELKPKNFVIKTSPYISCIMTACVIADQLGNASKKPTVQVDATLSQIFTTKQYAVDPLPNLEIF